MTLQSTNFKKFANLDFLIVIPSKGRHKTCHTTIDMFPNESCLYVHESEAEIYRQHNPSIPIVTHKQIKGYGSVINSAMRQAKKDGLQYVFFIDDDSTRMECMAGNKPRTYDLGKRYEALVNAVQVLADIDAYLYLFSTSSSIIKYQQEAPYKVGMTLPQGSYLVDVQNIGIYFEEGYNYYEDFDFCMQYLLKHRYIISEQRTMITGTNVDGLTDGGCNSYRTKSNEEISRKWIMDKWKSHVKFAKNQGNNIRPASTVLRKAKQ